MDSNETGTGAQPEVPSVDAKQPIVENVKQVAAGAFERSQQKRGRGRPRKDGSPSRATVSSQDGNSIVGTEKQSAKAYSVDVKLVERVVASGLVAIDGWIVRSIKARARLCGADARTIEEIGASVAMVNEERSTIAELFGVLAQKYGMLGKFAPEMMLAVVVSGYGFRVALSYSQTAAMLADARKLKAQIA